MLGFVLFVVTWVPFDGLVGQVAVFQSKKEACKTYSRALERRLADVGVHQMTAGSYGLVETQDIQQLCRITNKNAEQ